MDRASRQPATEQLSLPTLLGLFLVPGALITLAYVLLAPLIDSAGFPPIAALLVAIVIVLLPFELGVVLRAAAVREIDRSCPIDDQFPSATGCGWFRC